MAAIYPDVLHVGRSLTIYVFDRLVDCRHECLSPFANLTLLQLQPPLTRRVGYIGVHQCLHYCMDLSYCLHDLEERFDWEEPEHGYNANWHFRGFWRIVG